MAIQFTGSLDITGSLYVNGTSITGSGGGGGGSSTMYPTIDWGTKTIDLTGVKNIGAYEFYQLSYFGQGTTVTEIQRDTSNVFTLSNVDDLETTGYFSLAYTPFTGSITFPKLKAIGYNTFYSNANIAGPSYGYRCFQEFNAPSCSYVGYQAFGYNQGMISCSIGTATNIEFIGGNAFTNCAQMQYLDLRTISGSNALGGSPANNNVFFNIATGGTAYVPSFLSASNVTQPDGDIDYLQNTRGWTINWV